MCPWLKCKRMAWNARPASESVKGRNQVAWMRCQGPGPVWAEARSSLRGAHAGVDTTVGVMLGGQDWRATGGLLEVTRA